MIDWEEKDYDAVAAALDSVDDDAQPAPDYTVVLNAIVRAIDNIDGVDMKPLGNSVASIAAAIDANRKALAHLSAGTSGSPWGP